MDIEALVKNCQEQVGCERCNTKRACHRFKDLIKNLTEPWELQRLKEAVYEEPENKNG